MNPNLPTDLADSTSFSDKESRQLFDSMFPQGVSGPDVFHELAPAGWDQSPFLAVFHPSIDQVWKETVDMHANLAALSWGSRGKAAAKKRKAKKPPTREEIALGWKETPVDERSEIADVLGRCLWDIFSDNNDVVSEDGRVVHLGSFRGSARFIADLISEQIAGLARNYMDYYMGSIWISGRADLGPVYRLIFSRLKAHNFDWKYAFPRIHLIRFDKPEVSNAGPGDYSPSQSFERESEQAKEDAEHARMVAELDEIDAKARAEARSVPPPATVAAYAEVFARFPLGWPP